MSIPVRSLLRSRRLGVERGEVQRMWPGAAWDVLVLAWFRGVVGPAGRGYALARMRAARSRPGSRWWSPGVGDRITDCRYRAATVAAVSVRSGVCSVVYDPDGREPARGEVHFRDCADPITEEAP